MASPQTLMDDIDAYSMNEMQKLVESLPTEKAATGDALSLYNGYWYPPAHVSRMAFAREHFQAHDTDVILATAPKSGTTWLKALVFAITKRTHYPISDPNHPLLVSSPHGLVPFLTASYRGAVFPRTSMDCSPPRLVALHLPYSVLSESVKTSNCKIIYLCRNPKDTFVSMWHFGNKMQTEPIPLSEAFDKFCKGLTCFGPWWEQSLEYWKMSLERPEKVLFLKYEDMKRDVASQVNLIAEHLGYPFSVEEEKEGVIDGIVRMCSFEHLANLEPNKSGEQWWPFKLGNKDFFRKGMVGDWVQHLTPSMAKELDRVVEEKLQGTGLLLN